MKYDIFSTPIYIGKVEDDKKFKQHFSSIDLTTFAKPTDIYNPSWLCNVNTSHGTNDCKFEDKWVESFLSMIENHVTDFVSSIKTQLEFELNPSLPWVNIYNKGQYQDTHTHVFSGNVLSYCYYYNLPDTNVNGGKFYFVNSNADKVAFGQEYGISVVTAERKYFPDVTTGDIVIFPSWLEHGVSAVTGEETRITISGNIRINVLPTINY